MAELIDTSYFLELSEQDQGDVCRRALCQYDGDKNQYSCSVWGDEFFISPAERQVQTAASFNKDLIDYLSLFVVHYLLRAKEIQLLGEWISEKDIQGGAAFFRGPHELPTSFICQRFENDINEFKQACEKNGGLPLNMADAAYSFNIVGRIPVAVLYWIGDEDFPAEAKLLFDRSIGEHLPLDIIYALAVIVCKRLGAIHK